MSEEFKHKAFIYEWRIENFNYCWHKTGEHLESPLFHIDSPIKTSWRLWMYPRGEEDGEYISCYLFREEGGPEVLDVDFELFVSVGSSLVKPPVAFEKIYSFKTCQKEGEKCFAWRREIFSSRVAQKEKFTLVFGCAIFNPKGERFEGPQHFGRTTISMECISGMEVFDDDAPTDSENNIENIEVRAPFRVDSLVSINFLRLDEYFGIRIIPKSCEKIKYASCKITVIKNWARESPIEHFRYWIGEIQTDVWIYNLNAEAEPSQEVETCANKVFFLHYQFSYSNGVEHANNEMYDYGTNLWIENDLLLKPTSKIVKSEKTKDPSGYLTIAGALESEFASEIFWDLKIKTRTSLKRVNKDILRARSSKITEMLKDDPEAIEILHYTDEAVKRFLEFLYTDKIDGLYWPMAVELSYMAIDFEVELLKKKCLSFLKTNRNIDNISELLLIAESVNDLSLKAEVQQYIMDHDEEIFSTYEWNEFAESHWSLAEEYMLLKYKQNK